MSTTAANANASDAASPTSYDVLAELDRLLDATPHGSHVCKPLKRAVVAAAAAEIRRLRVQLAMAAQDQPKPKAMPPVPSKPQNSRG
jgi:hypothetical protein